MSLTRLSRAVAFLAFGLTSAHSQVPNLQGYVYDLHHNKVEGATATIGPNGRSSKETDSEGFFSIEPGPSVKLGSPITLQIRKNGFRTYSKHMDYTGFSQVITLTAESPAHGRAPTRTTPPPIVQTQPPVAALTSPAQPPPPLWSPAGDQTIDYVQQNLSRLPSDATDAQTTSFLRELFDAPIFGSVGEELPEYALYRFCRTERILTYYQLRFRAPELKTAAATASQNLIYLQDVFADLYGPAFSAKEHCNNFGARPRSEYQSNLGQPLKPRSSLNGVKAQEIINKMLTTLYAVGLSSHAPPVLPLTPPVTVNSGGTISPVATAVIEIDSARLNDWLDQGNKGGNRYWLKSIWLSIDKDERQLAKDLPFDADVPQVDQSFTLTKGRHKFRFRLEFDFIGKQGHEQFPLERLGDIEVDQNETLTPFLTVRKDEIKQWLLLKGSDSIPTRTAR